MPTLHEMQRDFASSMLSSASRELLPHLSGPHVEAGARLYARTVQGTLTQALLAIYPVLQRLLGARCFDGLARQYIRDIPSRSGDLHEFGDELPAFIARTPLHAEYPYLSDVARLEWSMHCVFHAAFSVPLDWTRLSAVSAEDFADLAFSLAPASALLSSPYPIHRIWEANQAGQDGSLTLDGTPTHLLLLRGENRIEMHPLDAVEFGFLADLAAERSFLQAVQHALEQDPDFDVQSTLQREVSRGCLVDFHLGSPSQTKLSGFADVYDQARKDSS